MPRLFRSLPLRGPVPRTLRALGALVLCLVPCVPAAAAAQSATYGALAGLVVDAEGRPVADASVRVVDRASGATRRVVTVRDGAFIFGVLTPAEYDVTIEALGYRPVVHAGVGILAGNRSALRVVLRAERPPVTRIDTVRAAGTRLEPGSWLVARGYSELAGARRLASDAAALSTIAGDDAVEGLPWRFADLMVDGTRLGAVGAMGLEGNATHALGLPGRAVTAVTVGGTGFDVETGGSGVGLSALSLRGGGVPMLRATGFGGSSDVGGALALGGPIQGDTAQAIIGADFQMSEIGRPAWFGADDAEGLAIASAAANIHGTDLGPLVKDRALRAERRSGYARLDWQVGDRYAIVARAAGSRIVTRDLPLPSGFASVNGERREATMAQASVGVIARLAARMTAELRVSGDAGDASSEAPAIDATAFASRGIVVGGAGDEPADEARSALRASGALLLDAGAHRLKVGGVVATHHSDGLWADAGSGAFAFGDATDLAAGVGTWRGLETHAGSGGFRMVERAFFVQDGWTVTDGLAVTLGLRFDGNHLPAGDLDANADWLAASGIDNSRMDEATLRVAPRVGFRWEMGADRSWVFSGGAGVYNDLPDRRDLSDALAYDTGVEVRSAVGSLGGWPAVPSAGVAPSRGRTLTVLGPEFEGPRTRRLALGVQRDAGPWTVFLRGTYRHTDLLGRRRDLNQAAPGTTDQFGRPLSGTLQQVGALLAAVPGSNRRFAGFDAVTAIEATGFSDFIALTAGFERVVPIGLSYAAHATYSRTEDNLAGAATLALLPLGADGRPWTEGTADTDIPLRVLGAAEWAAGVSGAFRLGVIYRGHSGAPFTAGFRPGVDANGDGIAGNDPAYVDGAVPGMAALLDTHACLRDDAGGIATRNACRADWVHTVDVRASIRIATLGAGPLDLVVDAIDLLAAERGRLDGALYLVDRTGALLSNPTTGVTTVPLVANPAFGTVVADRSAGPLFRVGLRIGR